MAVGRNSYFYLKFKSFSSRSQQTADHFDLEERNYTWKAARPPRDRYVSAVRDRKDESVTRFLSAHSRIA